MDELILKELWGELVLVDRLGSTSIDQKELVLQKHNRNLKVYIYSESNHNRPHIHIKWKKDHEVSVAIDNCDVLAGNIPSKYLREIKTWINKHKAQILEYWHQIQSGLKPQLLWGKKCLTSPSTENLLPTLSNFRRAWR